MNLDISHFFPVPTRIATKVRREKNEDCRKKVRDFTKRIGWTWDI